MNAIGLYRAERAIAERLLTIAAGKLPWPDIDVEKALPWVERKTGLVLAPGQADAVRLALTSKATVITGGPGVGKTTIVNSILRILAAKDVDLLLCAPSGRAARRMSEATGLEARTIHRLLEVDPRTGGFRRGADSPLDCGLLVVDETSMVDVMLMRALLAAVPDGAALLIVDRNQIREVGRPTLAGLHGKVATDQRGRRRRLRKAGRRREPLLLSQAILADCAAQCNPNMPRQISKRKTTSANYKHLKLFGATAECQDV